MDDYKYMNTHR